MNKHVTGANPFTIVLGNSKGGTGKSTLAMHLTVALLQAGYRVGSIDLDGGQASFSRYLANRTATFAEMTMDKLIAASRDEPSYCLLLVDRIELKPAHAMAMFWWADSAARRKILTRHAAERQEMIALCSDVFEMAAAEGWQDPVVRKALQMIERRQRNRGAIERSPYDSLEDAVQAS